MAGEPLRQAQDVARALIESLDDNDHLELIQFSGRIRRWRRQAAFATAAARRDAVAWIAALSAGGGTEMRDGVMEALRPLRADAQRQVVLITDGLIGFESEIVGTLARALPGASRLHTVGVGPSVNRTLTAPAARAGRGIEVVIGLGEDPGPSVARLLARMRAPILTEIKLSGSALLDHAPAAVPDVHAGAPLRLAVALRPDGGDLVLRGRTPTSVWEQRLAVPRVEAGEGNPVVVGFFGRESVEDLEVQRAAGAEVDRDVERIGLDFQIATRLTSWVAVSEEPAVNPAQPVRRERIPHALPSGLSIEGLGLRSGSSALARATSVHRVAFAFESPFNQAGIIAHQAAPDLLAEDRTSTWSARAGRLLSRHGPTAKPLTGRLVLRNGRDLTIEIDVEAPLEWEPDAVNVVWPGAARVPADIVADRTTSPSTVAAGLTVRLGLRLVADAPADLPHEVVLTSKGRLVTIVLRRG